MDSGKKLVLVTGDLYVTSYIDEASDRRILVSSESVHRRILKRFWASGMFCIGSYHGGGGGIEAVEQVDVSKELYNRFRYIQTSNSDGDLLNLLGTVPCSDSIQNLLSSQDLDSSLNVMSTFLEKILESTPEDALLLFTDHRLILLPNILKRKRKTQKVGIMLFQPFPHYDWFRNSCIGEEILLGILGADLVSFISSESAYNFVNACQKIFGYKHTCIDGNLFVDCEGRQLLINTIPITIDSTQFLGILAKEDVTRKVNQLKNKYLGKKVILAVDEIESFKGIQLQLMVVEYLLGQKKEIVFIQLIKGSSRSGDIISKKNKVKAICETINIKFGTDSYNPIVVEFVEDVEASRVPYYVISDCLINLCLKDMIYQIGYEYFICKQNGGHLLVSEFLSSLTSLKGVIRVNPRKTKEVAEALSTLLFQPVDMISQTHLQENHTYIRNNDVNVWPKKIFHDLHGKCESYGEEQLVSLGDGLKHMLILHDKAVVKLNINLFKQSYRSSTRKRVIYIDFDQLSTEFDVKSMVAFDKMCKDNHVFLFTKMSRGEIEKVFGAFLSLTICAENGFCWRLSQSSQWQEEAHPQWKLAVEAIMKKYTKNAEGLFIETTGAELSCNFRGLAFHLRSCYQEAMLREISALSIAAVSCCSTDHVVYVKTQGVDKGVAATKLVQRFLGENSGIDFGLCIGFGEVDQLLVKSFEEIPLTEEANRQLFSFVVVIAPNMKSKSGLYLNNWGEFFELLRDLYGGESSYSGLAAET